MRERIFLLMAIMAITSSVLAQPRPMRGEQGGQFIFVETANLPSSSPNQSRIDLFYRVDREFFIAVRNADTSYPYAFIRRGDISVELIDSAGVSRARTDERIAIGEESERRDPSRKSWHQGIFSFEVAPGLYHIAIELTDHESKRDYADRGRTVRAAAFGSRPLEISTPIFLTGNPPSSFPDTVLAENYGNDLLWASQSCLFFMISGASLTDSACDVRYTLAFAPHSSEETKQVAEENLPGLVPVRGLEALPVKIGENVGYRLVRGGNASSAFLFLGFHSDTLLLRDYRLEVEIAQGARKDKAVKRFRMVWPDMPASLRNVDYALDALRFITTESQLDSLKSGNYETRKENLEAFWKGIDRTTGGPRNAAMVEYYERVDEATKSFGTLRQPDGSKSDRGRIYVLYGPPTRTERSLDPATGFTEVWTYERVNRKFTFRDQSKTGDYALIATTAP